MQYDMVRGGQVLVRHLLSQHVTWIKHNVVHAEMCEDNSCY